MEEKLIEIYQQRKQDIQKLMDEGKSFDEIKAEVQHYQDEIDAIFPKKNEKSLDFFKLMYYL